MEIPTTLTRSQFERHIEPSLSKAKRGYVSKVPLYKIFNEVYKKRFVIERTFAWIDKFRALVTRYERKDVYWLGFHLIAFTLINRHYQDRR